MEIAYTYEEDREGGWIVYKYSVYQYKVDGGAGWPDIEYLIESLNLNHNMTMNLE